MMVAVVQEKQINLDDFVSFVEGKKFQDLPEILKNRLLNFEIQVSKLRISKKSNMTVLEKNSVTYNVKTLYEMFKQGEIKLPIFQRNQVWNKEKKSELIYTLLSGGIIPEIITFEKTDNSNTYLILLDGWQRLSTIIDYIDGKFKIKLDPNLEHINPFDTDEAELLKNVFERINYKSTPLSRYRLALLTAYALSSFKEDEKRNELEKKIKAIIQLAWKIKSDDKQENSLGFVIRALTSYWIFFLLETDPEALKRLTKNKSYGFTAMLAKIFKRFLEEISYNDLTKLLQLIYKLIIIIFPDSPQKVVTPQNLKYAETIGLVLYLIKIDVLNEEISRNISQTKSLISTIIKTLDEILTDPRKNKKIGITKYPHTYLNALKKLQEHFLSTRAGNY